MSGDGCAIPALRCMCIHSANTASGSLQGQQAAQLAVQLQPVEQCRKGGIWHRISRPTQRRPASLPASPCAARASSVTLAATGCVPVFRTRSRMHVHHGYARSVRRERWEQRWSGRGSCACSCTRSRCSRRRGMCTFTMQRACAWTRASWPRLPRCTRGATARRGTLTKDSAACCRSACG
jgi:hypothetical protein